MQDLKDKFKGEIAIIGGFSPFIFDTPELMTSLVGNHPVIGINKWGAIAPCDAWIGLDTGINIFKWWLSSGQDYEQWVANQPQFKDEPKFLSDLKAVKFMRKPNTTTEKHVSHDMADYWFDQPPQDILVPTKWTGYLRWTSSTALCAINLAIILEAKSCILFGVDFVGDGRADGSQYISDNFWESHKEAINTLLKQYQEHIDIYKTHPDSWLDCQLYKEQM
jgi:hypothetical protein